MINQAKLPFVFFNSATSVVTDKSPYYVRASFTSWQTYTCRWRNGRCEQRTTRPAEMFMAELLARPGCHR